MRLIGMVLLCLGLLALAACNACEPPAATPPGDAVAAPAPPPDGDEPPPSPLEGPIPYGSSVIITLDEEPEEGRFPLIHIFRSVSPRARACSVKPGVRGIVVGELRLNEAYYLKVRTPQCTGFVRDTLVRIP